MTACFLLLAFSTQVRAEEFEISRFALIGGFPDRVGLDCDDREGCEFFDEGEPVDVCAFLWSIIDKPIGSSASIATPTNDSASFVPDVGGDYTLIKAVSLANP